MTNTLQQHGFKGDEVANVIFRKNDIQTNQFHGFVVEVQGTAIASGFNTEAKAKEWAKRKGVKVESPQASCPACGAKITHGLNGFCSFVCAVESKIVAKRKGSVA